MPKALSAFGYNTLVQPIISSANLITGLTLAGAAGTSGQVLTSAGSGLPTWSTAAGFTLGTPVDASGTSVTFTGIPAGTKQIVMTFSGVTISDNWRIQLGDSGGIETSGYVSNTATISSGPVTQLTTATNGFVGTKFNSVGYSGAITCTLLNASTFLWTASGTVCSTTGDTPVSIISGSKALSAVLTQIRLTTNTGTASFTTGSLNIAYA